MEKIIAIDSDPFALARSKLEKEALTCVLTDGERFFTSSARGVKPLVQFIEGGQLPEGLYAADKVVGKATAFLYVILKIRKLYAAVISEPALALLEQYGISVSYGVLTPNIINRRGDGICPFEEAVLTSHTPTEGYSAILKKMDELKINLSE